MEQGFKCKLNMTREDAKKWISKACGEGWLDLVDEVYDNLPKSIEITQVYQKWAGLHFDTSKENETFDLYLYDIQEKSESTCDKCGAVASHYVISNWEYARCIEHSEGGIDLNNLPEST